MAIIFFLNTWNHELGSVFLKETSKDVKMSTPPRKDTKFVIIGAEERLACLEKRKNYIHQKQRPKKRNFFLTVSTQKEKPSFLGDPWTDTFEGFKYLA